eukprot:401589_1
MAQAKGKAFVQDLFKNEESEETHVKIRDGSKSVKKTQNKFSRANTNVGVMNKFILQFNRVEKAYREVEEAFILIARSESTRSLQERMKRKCKMPSVSPILVHLGFSADDFSNKEIQTIFDKDPESDAHISFQRLLIGVGLCYFAKLDKEQKAKGDNEDSNTEVEYNEDGTKKDDVLVPQDNDDKKQSERELRFGILGEGFEVVKAMFDVIDEDGSGEISLEEFESCFNNICRDPAIVKQRMKELDYNNDQNISFREFIFGISSWCGFNDEMINDDADGDLDIAPPPS